MTVSINSTSEEVLGFMTCRYTRLSSMVSINSTSEEVLGIVYQVSWTLPKVSINSTSEEVLGPQRSELVQAAIYGFH